MVPHSQQAVDEGVAATQKAVSRLVLGQRQWLKASEATQPRACMGIGMVDVRRHMAATWAGPLLRAMGSERTHRPFKGYFAQQARAAYPQMDMGRELLTLNLSFERAAHARTEGPRRHGGGQTQGASPVERLTHLGPGGLIQYPQPGAPERAPPHSPHIAACVVYGR